MATVRLDSMLRDFVPRRTVRNDATSIEELLGQLETDFPKLRHRLRDETGVIRRFVKIFVNGEEIGALQGLNTPLKPDDEVDILHSIQGG